MSVRAAVISDAEWERHRATIEALYAEHRLDTVVRQLREKYNFDATEKQYKRRLAKWNVAKNVKSCEVLRLIDEPAAPRTIRGQWVSEVKIKRHRRRLRGRLSVAWNSTENSAQQSEARLQQCRVPGDTEDHSSHSPSQAFSVQVDPRNDKGFGDGVKSSIEDDHADKPEPTTLASLGLPTRGVPVAAVGSQALRPNSVQSEGQIYDPAVVKIALLQNMLFLNKNHFERNLSEEAFTADVRAVNLRNLDVAQRIDLHRLFPSLSEREVFIAAYLLYRRRGIFLLTSRGTTTTENVLAAVCLARPGDLIHHLSSDFGPGRNARILMQEETKLPKLHDPTAWQKWFSLMSTILKDIFEHLPNRDCWQPQRTSSSLETAVSEQHLAAHNLMQLRRIVLPPISSRGIGYQLDEPGTMIPVEDWELSTVFDGKFDENKRVYIIG